MSTYATSEQALLECIRLLSDYTDANSARGDFRVIDAKGVTLACVLTQAGNSEFGDNLGQGRGTQGKRQQRHRINAIVFQKRLQDADGPTYTALGTAVSALIAHLDTYQRLNNGPSIKRAEVVDAGVPLRRRDSTHIYQAVVVEVLTETAPVLVEASH